MIDRSTSALGILVLTCVLLLVAAAASAQQASGIAGAVRDASGAVLPGVTVEAASPALIEKVRTVVTDGQGRYSLVALVAGTYTVTFTLPGFRTVQQPGVVLTAGFTATVNADMAVGALEETITVTGESPLVDTQNVRTQTLVSDDLLDVLPTGPTAFGQAFVSLTPGLTAGSGGGGTQRGGVGGSEGVFWGNFLSGALYHGKGGFKVNFDGMRTEGFGGGAGGAGGAAYVYNMNTVEEITLETSGVSAESTSTGVEGNAIPKSGGNTFTFLVSGLYSSGAMQSDLSDEARARVQALPEELDDISSFTVAVGGPIKRDKLWFFTAPKGDHTRSFNRNFFFNSTQGTPFYTPDLSRPGYRDEEYRSTPVRLTWQASAKDKVNAFVDYQPYCGCARSVEDAAEANFRRAGYTRWFQGSWTRPATDRFLLEAGGSVMRFTYAGRVHESVRPEHISIEDTLNGFRYNVRGIVGSTGIGEDKYADRYFQRYSASYITGSHAFKVGLQLDNGFQQDESLINQDVTYIFRGSSPGNATPLTVTQFATPYTTRGVQKADLGIYAQDQWAVKRLTLNLGLRFTYFNAYVPAQHAPAGRWVDARDFAAVHNAPNWKDLSPRLGAAYDLFGNGRTALKMSLNHYLDGVGLALAATLNPLAGAVNQVNRDWNDSNGNYIPDCNLRSPAANGECGAWQDLNFGGTRAGVRYADGILEGFGVRQGIWDVTAEVQHQLTREISVTAGYYRNWAFNMTVTDNLAVTPEDYSPFFITAPVDARLPGGGGYAVSGLYDLSPTKLGQVDNLVRKGSDFGKPKIVNDFIGLNLQTRFGSGRELGGGLDVGRSVTDNCFVIDTPQLVNCRVVTAFWDQAQLKLFGSSQLPGNFQVSAIFKNIPGQPILANYTVTRAQIQGLARPLSTSSRSVPLMTPGTEFEERQTQLDLQLANIIRLGRYRLAPNLGIFNVFNANSTVVRIDTYGPRWGASRLLGGRLLQVSADLTF